MKLSELKPDAMLAALLKDKVKVQVSKTESRIVKAYADGERPNVNLADEFIDVVWNGAARSLTEPLGLFTGNLALTIQVKTYPDGRTNKIVTQRILGQVYDIVEHATEGRYHYTLRADNVVMPLTTNNSTGYSSMTINVQWHTTSN